MVCRADLVGKFNLPTASVRQIFIVMCWLDPPAPPAVCPSTAHWTACTQHSRHAIHHDIRHMCSVIVESFWSHSGQMVYGKTIGKY